MDTNRLQAILLEMMDYEHGPVMNSLILEAQEILGVSRCQGVALHGNRLTWTDEATGVPWLAVTISYGDRYGRFDPSDPSGLRLILHDGSPMIEFWDRRYDHDPEHHAQFVSRYYSSTLQQARDGLLLDPATSGGTLDARSLALVKKYLINQET